MRGFTEMDPSMKEAMLGTADTEPELPVASALDAEDTKVDYVPDFTSEAVLEDSDDGEVVPGLPKPTAAELAARTPVTGPAEGGATTERGGSLYIGEDDEEGVISNMPGAKNPDSYGPTIDNMPVVDVPPEQRN